MNQKHEKDQTEVQGGGMATDNDTQRATEREGIAKQKEKKKYTACTLQTLHIH